METTIQNTKQLIREVKGIYSHQQEIKRLRGEYFNVFSILRMEYKENATHSAFLGELLSPTGSHLFKELFLELFLKLVGYNGQLNPATAHVELERYIGLVDISDKTGGRIDIYISDSQGNSISIENKINAKDQQAQIERYVNYNKERNTVYYLTLEGNQATDQSSGELQEDSDYNCISYKQDIIEWLTACMKEASEQPILRESIKQYILLIKKITNQLTDNVMEKQVIESIKKNYQAAVIIADNIWKADLEMTKTFLIEIKHQLESELNEGFQIMISEDLNQKYTGLYITHKDWNGIGVSLEGQPKIPWNDTVYGISAHRDVWDRANIYELLSNVFLTA